MEEIKLNEKELIQLTMQYGYDGSELENKHFQEKGYLKNNNKYQKFIEKVESICESYEKLRKVKGEEHPYYILKGVKEIGKVEKVSEDHRSTAQQDDDDKLMAKHLYNSLLSLNKDYPRTLNKWTIDIGGLNPKLISMELIHELFDEMYYGADLSNIHHSVTDYIKQRNEKVASKSIKILKQNELIDVEEVYRAITIDTEYITIDKDTYEDWKNQFKEIVEKYEFEMKNYKFHINKEENKEFKDEIEKFQEESGIKTVYIAYKLQIKKRQQPFDITYIDFQATYNDKIIKLITQLPKCKKEHQLFFSARFKKFNYLMVLKMCNWTIHIDDTLIEELKPNPIYIDLIIHERRNHRGMEKIIERWRKVNDSFGALLEGDITLDEFSNVEERPKRDLPSFDDKLPYTLNELLADVTVPDYTYIPFDLSDNKQDIHKDSTYNDKELHKAVHMIKQAFPNAHTYQVA